MRNIFANTSWPAGKWQIKYIEEQDKYEIITEFGVFIAFVGPTLVAHWLVIVYNAIYIGADQ